MRIDSLDRPISLLLLVWFIVAFAVGASDAWRLYGHRRLKWLFSF